MAQYLNPYAGISEGLMGAANIYANKELQEEEEAKRKADLEEKRAYEEKIWKRGQSERDAKAALTEQKRLLAELQSKNEEYKGRVEKAKAESTQVDKLGGGDYALRQPMVDEQGQLAGYTDPKITRRPERAQRPLMGEFIRDGQKYVYDKNDPQNTQRLVGPVDTNRRDNTLSPAQIASAEAKIAAIDSMDDRTIKDKYGRDGNPSEIRARLKAPLEKLLMSGQAPEEPGGSVLGAIGGALKTGLMSVANPMGSEADIASAVAERRMPAERGAQILADRSGNPVNMMGATATPKAGKPGSSKDNPVVVASKAEIESLPSGTWFKTPKGVYKK